MSICLHMSQQENCLHCLKAEVEQLRQESAQLWTYVMRQPCTCEAEGEVTCERCQALGVGG